MNNTDNEITLEGTIEHIIFRNDDNGYTVFALDGTESAICVGTFLTIEEGMYVKVSGTEKLHPTYGPQFQVDSMQEAIPTDEIALEKYLGSGVIKGIGPKLAHSIIVKFGAKTLKIMEDEPEKLAEVRGISENKARDIYSQVIQSKEKTEVMLFLQKYNIPNKYAVKMYDHYQNELLSVIKENPYRLSDEIEGFGFKKADDVAMAMGFDKYSEVRIEYCVIGILKGLTNAGHLFYPINELEIMVSKELEFKVPDFEDMIRNMAIENKVVIKTLMLDGIETKCVYLSYYYSIEYNSAVMINNLNVSVDIDETNINKKLDKFEKNNEITLDSLQRKGVIEAVKNTVFVLTGGPGTGKTTTIRAIIDIFNSQNMEILLCAPTGRAARRMTQATGYPAQTIHRLLEVEMNKGNNDHRALHFNRNEDNPLECDALIIDEMSMVDMPLFYNLLKAISVGTYLIFIGDTSQLPSVGPGSVLKDLLNSNVFNSLTLTQIFRQDEKSDIVINAHKINNGIPVDLETKTNDFYFFKQSSVNTIKENLKILINEKLPEHTGFKPMEMQVLTPTKKGALGSMELNEYLQEFLNKHDSSKNECSVFNTTFRVGDKVIQTKNNYQLEWKIYGKNDIVVDEGTGVFNGDIGVIEEIDGVFEEITVVFDDEREVVYPYVALEELDLAYALTVHKSQGSEYPVVIIPLFNVPPLLKYRNLIYTAITRAQSLVVLLGNKETFVEMVNNEKEKRRYSAFKTYIQEIAQIDNFNN